MVLGILFVTIVKVRVITVMSLSYSMVALMRLSDFSEKGGTFGQKSYSICDFVNMYIFIIKPRPITVIL